HDARLYSAAGLQGPRAPRGAGVEGLEAHARRSRAVVDGVAATAQPRRRRPARVRRRAAEARRHDAAAGAGLDVAAALSDRVGAGRARQAGVAGAPAHLLERPDEAADVGAGELPALRVRSLDATVQPSAGAHRATRR